MSRTILPFLITVLLVARTSAADPGILLLAHGGSAEWNGRVTELAAKIDATQPHGNRVRHGDAGEHSDRH